MSWLTGPLAAFDLETTGVDVRTDRLVTACVARVDASGRERPSAATWLANPGVEIPAKATEIHGVTTARAVAEGQDPEEVVSEVAGMLIRALGKGIPIVGFNIRFDLTLLEAECRRYGLPTVSELTDGCAPVICARVLDKHVSRRKGIRKLENCCEYWGVRLDDAHNAAADAIAAAGLAVHIARQNPSIARMSLPDLHAAQRDWHYEQCMSHAAYKRRQMRAAATADEQLELHAFATQLEEEAQSWPVAPLAAAQEQLG